MKSIIKTALIILLFPFYVQAQVTENKHKYDTLYTWRSKFYDISIQDVSPSHRWISIPKWRNIVSDTLLLVDTQNPKLAPLNIVKMGQLDFTGTDYLLSRGADRAAWWDLSKRSVINFKNVRQAAILSALESFAVLDKNKNLKIFDRYGKVIFEQSGVNKIISDDDKNLAFLKIEDKKSVVYTWNLKSKNKIFTSEDELERFKWDSSNNFLISTLRDKKTNTQNLVILNQKTGVIDNSFSSRKDSPTYTSLSPINDTSFFVENQTARNVKGKVVELWYGNDGDLNKTLSQTKSKKDFGSYNTLTKKLESFPTERFPSYSNILNTRYFLAFDRNGSQNYLRWIPDVDFYLYDSLTKNYTSLGRVRERISASPNGDYLTYQDSDNKWMLFDLKKQQHFLISSLPIYEPVFDQKGNNLFFASKNGIYTYDLQKKNLQIMKETAGLQATVVNKNSNNLSTNYEIHSPFIDANNSVVVKLFDPLNNKTSCGVYKNGHFKTILWPTENSLDDLHYSDKTRTLIYREENYNLFPRIKIASTKGENLLFTDEAQDKIAQKIQQEVVSYTDSQNTPLKGLLYYPSNFDPKKKYPLIVHIYQILSKYRNDYTTPGELSEEGFDLRALLERGYMVYLPDIVFSKTGSGVSALDCVNKALDALSSKTFIDPKRIGLTGHSHGGYETNFIATHSDRFAAYVSGAGNSDLVRSYFSYNYNFEGPFYWQYETGQYEMTSTFAQDKNLYVNNSPIYNVEKISAPILLWAGKHDENIAWDQGMEFFVGLKRNQKDVIALFYPNAGHSVGINTEEMSDLNFRILDWWDYFLKDRKNIPWIQKQMKKDAD